MSDLPSIYEYGGEPVTTSRAIAEQFGKQHKHVIRDIESIITELNGNALNFEEANEPNFGPAEISTANREFAARNFFLTEYTDEKGERRKQYILTRDGFTLLAMGFTGAKAMQFKVAYINAFNRMESIISGEARLETAKQEASNCIEMVNSYAESDSLSGIVSDSLEAMRIAFKSNGIAFVRKRTGETKGGGDVVGLYDDFSVSIYTTELHKLYVEHTGDNMPFYVWIGIIKREIMYKSGHSSGRSRLTMSREKAGLSL